MTEQEKNFDSVVEERIDKIKSTLLIKGKEYRRNNNVFHNFEVGSNITGESREKVLYGFLLKHLISFQDMVNDIEIGKLPSENYINEKIGDICCYMILFEASIKEKIKVDNNVNHWIKEVTKPLGYENLLNLENNV